MATASLSNLQLSRSLERALDEAVQTGELILPGRKLRELSVSGHVNQKCDLSDTVLAGQILISSSNESRTWQVMFRSFSQWFDGISTSSMFVLLVGTSESLSQCDQIHSRADHSNPHAQSARSKVDDDWSLCEQKSDRDWFV